MTTEKFTILSCPAQVSASSSLTGTATTPVVMTASSTGSMGSVTAILSGTTSTSSTGVPHIPALNMILSLWALQGVTVTG